MSELDRLRKSARSLRRAHKAGDADALSRVKSALDDKPAEKHADFLHVIAVEAGQASWPKLKLALEAGAMNRAQRLDRLRSALFFGQHHVTSALLGADSNLADDALDLQIALYDLPRVKAALGADPTVASRRIGRRTALLHLACSRHFQAHPDLLPDMLAIAALLLDNGADPNASFAAGMDGATRVPALYGALGHAGNLALAERLLEAGADPNDDESLYHATELGHLDGLRLLLRFGARPEGTNALNRMLDFDNPDGVRLLLENRADPNEEPGPKPSGEPMPSIPALHQAARRGRSAAFADLLLEFGADPATMWQAHSAYSLARVTGNREFANRLRKLGHASPLSEPHAILAACADGSALPGRLHAADLGPEDRYLLTRIAAKPGHLAHLQRLVIAGLDPDLPDEMGLTALDVSGWEGLPDHLGFLLSLNPDLTRRNAFGGNALSTVVHGAEHCPARASRDHPACARLLLEAGHPLDPALADATGTPALSLLFETWLDAG